MRLMSLTVLTLSVTALAQGSAPAGADLVEPVAETTKVLPPFRADARVTVDTDILLAYVSLGVSADLGVVKLGPGTLAVGAGLDVGFCGTVCLVTGALLGGAYGQRDFFPMARVSYHLELPARAGNTLQKVNLYGFVFGGVVISSLSFSARIQGFDIGASSTGVGPGLGLGAGAAYFFSDRVSVGAEATLKYAAGVYNDVVVVEPPNSNVNYQWSSTYSSFSRSGLSIRFFLGFRI
jgi:hypothetical protein